MNIVLRCPKCGTTRATPGECDACHEAGVRYFCTDHEPGLWLETPTCPTCEARPREAPRWPAAPESPAPVRRSPPPVRARKPVAPAPYVLPERPRREVAEVPKVEPWDGHERLRPSEEAMVPGTEPLWQKIIRAALVARAMRRTATVPEGDGTSMRRVGGCLVRLVVAAVVLIIGLAGALYVFGRSMM